jgi:threonine dehydratase
VTRPAPTRADVLAARDRIAGTAVVTPVLASEPLSATVGRPVWLKLETLQETGSFKVRGAANALERLPDSARRAGVVCVSSGNHGRAVAHVAAALGIPATVCLSARVSEAKAEAIRRLGARVIPAGPDQVSAEAEARRLVRTEGLTFVHPFDDPDVIAGQGTVGLEVAAQVPGLAEIVVPLSGGGLAAGIALAVDAGGRRVSVVGVSQERGPAMHDSLRAGRLVDVVEEDTLADALAGGLGPENRYTFDLCRSRLDAVRLVSETEIAAAMRFLHREHGLRVEGGGAVGVAAVLSGRHVPRDPAVIVISGGNVSDEVWAEVVGE